MVHYRIWDLSSACSLCFHVANLRDLWALNVIALTQFFSILYLVKSLDFLCLFVSFIFYFCILSSKKFHVQLVLKVLYIESLTECVYKQEFLDADPFLWVHECFSEGLHCWLCGVVRGRLCLSGHLWQPLGSTSGIMKLIVFPLWGAASPNQRMICFHGGKHCYVLQWAKNNNTKIYVATKQFLKQQMNPV